MHYKIVILNEVLVAYIFSDSTDHQNKMNERDRERTYGGLL